MFWVSGVALALGVTIAIRQLFKASQRMDDQSAAADDVVEETSDESFPASDPPSWTGSHS
jgi:hypothetical protein